MGDKRVISKTIIQSAKFLKMPLSSQMLYIHLMLNADDDGIVEAYPVMQMTKASEDDLKVLHSKNFVFVLNEDYVSFIEDWRIHNSNLRADRKKDSIYKDLLLQLRPEVQLLEKKARSDVKGIKKSGPSMDGQRTDNGPPNITQHNITQHNVTQSIYPSIEDKKKRDRANEKNTKVCKTLIASNIELDSLRELAKRQGVKEMDMVEEIYSTICDMVIFPREIVTIKGTDYPWEQVRQQLLRLKKIHVANVLNRVIDANLQIQNMGAYLISMLYCESLNGTIQRQSELHDEYLKHLRGTPYSV